MARARRYGWVAATLLLLSCAHRGGPVATRAHAGAYAVGKHGAVTSAEGTASEVGLAVLARGGNAVDAAVAVGFALGVTHPSAANLGGGGFMILRTADGHSTAFDYRETAPAAATRDMFLDAQGALLENSHLGARAAGIPGVVAGFALAHQKFGRLPWAELLAPAIALARDGCVLDEVHANDLRNASTAIRRYAAALSGTTQRDTTQAVPQPGGLGDALAAFSRPDGSHYAAGETWRQPALADTLTQIAQGGAEAFYRGPLAQRMSDGVRAIGGIWTAHDLARYTAIERAPIEFDYHGHHIVTMPPPSAGGVLLREILFGADALALQGLPWDAPDRIHLYVEIVRRAYADRNALLGDPAFVDMPLSTLADPAYMRARVADIDPMRATPSARVGAGVQPSEGKHTTHFSIVDGSGMAVANTYTLNTDFGALVQIPGTGITLNNEMDDFTMKVGEANAFGLVQGGANAIAPGKRMLSSMSPTIVLRDGKLRAVLGSPGGPTITTTVAQLLLQLIDHGRPLHAAILAPRIHHQWLPDEIMLEVGVPESTQAALRARGHTVEAVDRIGHANCIELDPSTQELRATADVGRGGGGAVAY